MLEGEPAVYLQVGLQCQIDKTKRIGGQCIIHSGRFQKHPHPRFHSERVLLGTL